MAAFTGAAKGGLEVGRGQTGGSVHLPAGVPAAVAQQIERLATAVFTHGFVDAMRPTMVVPIVVVLLAAISALAVRRETRTRGEQPLSEPAREPASAA